MNSLAEFDCVFLFPPCNNNVPLQKCSYLLYHSIFKLDLVAFLVEYLVKNETRMTLKNMPLYKKSIFFRPHLKLNANGYYMTLQ